MGQASTLSTTQSAAESAFENGVAGTAPESTPAATQRSTPMTTQASTPAAALAQNAGIPYEEATGTAAAPYTSGFGMPQSGASFPDGETLAGYNTGGAGESAYNTYLKMLDDLEQASKSGMSAREFAISKGVPSSLTDEDAALLDKYNVRMSAEGAGKNDLFRGDDLLYEEKRPNGISKSHLNSVGDLVPANVDGIYKNRPVTVTEHILGGYRKGAKGNSPYTSFTNDKGIVATYGNNIIKVDLNGLIRDINAGKVRGVEVLTPEQVQALIKSDVQESEYWRDLALKWAKRDKEHLIKGTIPQKYITIITDGGK